VIKKLQTDKVEIQDYVTIGASAVLRCGKAEKSMKFKTGKIYTDSNGEPVEPRVIGEEHEEVDILKLHPDGTFEYIAKESW